MTYFFFMDQNGVEIDKGERRIYTKEVMNSLRNSTLSQIWPQSLDKTCVNSHGQWDPVKSFDGVKITETKRGNFYENKVYRTNDKNSEDISLRPERRKWNDGCQVSNNKRNNEDSHSNCYRKSYQGATPNNGGGDFDRRSYNRNNNRSAKLRDGDKEAKYNNLKTEKSSRNNSNLGERKDEKDEHIFNFKSCNNLENEPEWFSNGPENCDEIIELRGITANDSSIVNFKKDSSKNDVKDERVNCTVNDIEKLVLNFSQKSPGYVESCITSPKREGSRFQDIFQKETINNNLKESKDVENIIKAVLSDTVSKADAEKLNDVSKPLPNGVLTVEEIENGITSVPLDLKRSTSKSTTIDTLTSFEPSLNSLLSSGVSSPNVDNSKVVNWLSNLNMNDKVTDIEHKPFYHESPSYPPVNNTIIQQPMFSPVAYSKFIPNLQHPPGLPLMVNSNQLQQHHHLQQNQQLQQQHQHQLQNISIQHPQSLQNPKQIPYIKQLSLGPPSNINMTQRSPLLMSLQHEGFMQEKYKLNNQLSLPNDIHVDQNAISNFLKSNMQLNHINDRNMTTMNGPPGLTNMNMSRPIVKTNSPFMDFAQVNDLSYQYQNNFRRPINNNQHPLYAADINKPVTQFNSLDMYTNMCTFDNGAAQQSLMNNYQNQQQQVATKYDSTIPRSSSNKMLANLFSVNPSYLPPLPQQAKYADQIETENI